MLVYGDPARRAASGAAVDRLRQGLAAVNRMGPGLSRHQELVALFIEAAALWQGVADAEFEARGGIDDLSPAQDAITQLCMAMAGAVAASWQSGFGKPPPRLDEVMPFVAAAPLPPEVVLKMPEGYAFYGVYPEAYWAAAGALRGTRPVRVVGIRSIGTGLAAMIGAATGAPPPITLRPVGPPFRREISVSPRLLAALTRDDAVIAVADEGPGLSGSSFGAVADLLERNGVAPERIHFFPSHRGDLGPEADARHRQRWRTANRHVLDSEDLVLRPDDPAHRLERWIEDLTGPLTEPLLDISGGGWRAVRFRDEADWPAANIQQERRKFIARTARGTFLVKFAGLGREGARKVARGRALAAAGFSPEVLGFRHGFLVERWIEEARPLDPYTVDRGILVDSIGRYLAFRARHFSAAADQGASLADLWTMARHNTGQELGSTAAARLEARRPDLARLQSRMRRVEVDGRLHVAEWLVLPNGRLLKADALDHHASHDLVGCQDIAWDIAGATVELALSDEEAERLCRILEDASGRSVEPDLVRFYRPCYLAFQLGAYTLGAQALAGSPEEARLRRAATAYAGRLRQLLG